MRELVINGWDNLDGAARNQADGANLSYLKMLHLGAIIERITFDEHALTAYLTSDGDTESAQDDEYWCLWLAARKWMIGVIERNFPIGAGTTAFVVQAFSGKGERRLFSRTLTARYLESRTSFAAGQGYGSPLLPVPEPQLDEATAVNEVTKFYRALGEQYTHASHLALGTGGTIQTMMERVVERQEREIERLQQAFSDLQNRHEHTLEQIREGERQTQENVVELAKLHVTGEAVKQVGGVVQTVVGLKLSAANLNQMSPALQMAAQNPRLLTVFQRLTACPPLLDALQSDDVLRMLDDPQVLTMVAAQLRQLAALQVQSAQQPTLAPPTTQQEAV